MANLADSKMVIPGIGHVFFADVDTEAMNLDNFKFGDVSTYGDWTWLGDTSSENLISFESDGGEVTYKRTWDRTQVRATRTPDEISATINSVNITRETFELAWPGGDYDDLTKSYKVRTTGGTSEKALMVVMEDGTAIAAFRLPKTDIKGSFPSLDLEEFMEIPLNVAVLTSTADPSLLWEIFEARDYVGEAPAG